LITPDVDALRNQFHIPGTRVLQFAFDGNPDNPHLPQNYSTNTVVYTGTHDNNTTRGWFEGLSETEKSNVWRYLQRTGGTDGAIAGELVRVAWSSAAVIAIAPLQDLVNLGTEGRMNLPGSAEANWRWRATEDMLNTAVFERLSQVTQSSNRSHVAHSLSVAKVATQS
jgi:4-alpha-glucanotransferase